jgi:hypothetical protein
LLPKTIDSAFGTEKDDKKLEESQKMDEKIDKKRISKENQKTNIENQRTDGEKHHYQVVPQ